MVRLQYIISASSYYTYDNAAGSANSKGFFGGIHDGRYIYMVPFNNGSNFGQVTRLDGFTGNNLISMENLYNANMSTVNDGDLVQYDSGTQKWFNKKYINLFFNKYKNLLSEGYNQGGLSSGSVGARKSININTVNTFDVSTVGYVYKGTLSGVYDGKYIYGSRSK